MENNVAAIQKEILKHGPVEAGFTVYNDFLSYKSGLYNQCLKFNNAPKFIFYHTNFYHKPVELMLKLKKKYRYQ